jgi:hypothetical protein
MYFDIVIFCAMLVIRGIAAVMRNSYFIWEAILKEVIAPEAIQMPQSVLFVHCSVRSWQ